MSTRGSLSPIPDEDPVQALLRDIQQNGVTGPLDIDTGANTEADTGTSTEPACPVDEGSELPANITEGSRRRPRSETSSNIHDVVEHLKRRKMFTDQSRADLDLFEQSPADIRGVLLYGRLLAVHDELESQRIDKPWVVTKDLGKKLRKYAFAFVTSPNVAAYRGNGAEVILAALKAMKVDGIPPEKEQGRVEDVLAYINTQLTAFRNQLKDHIKESDKCGSKLRNVALLAKKIVGTHRIPLTLPLYMRIAFIRWHVVKYPELVKNDPLRFWLTVDQTIKTTSATGKDSATKFFNTIYEADKLKYGDPAKSGVSSASITTVDEWLSTVDKHASTAIAVDDVE